jgi:GT2 family glycosyltransferase
VVVLTYCRRQEVLRTVQSLIDLHNHPAIIVVDNGSTDGTVNAVRVRFPGVQIISLKTNIGAAGRNVGVRAAQTPYVALCDDDTVWASGSLRRAADVLDRYHYVAVVTGQVLVGGDQHEDPTCLLMAESPLIADRALPGPCVLGFLAGASMVRRSAFLGTDGFEPKLFLGGEEALLALDLVENGWEIVYMNHVIVYHYPSPGRDTRARRLLLIRNALWVTWLRRPVNSVMRETMCLARSAIHDGGARRALLQAFCGLLWIMQHRRCISARIEALLLKLEASIP